MLCNTPSTVTPVSKRKESLFPPAYVVTSIDTPCSARSCGRERLSSERGALCATSVLDIRTSTELSITLRISTRSIDFNEIVATAFCSLLKFFSSIQNRQIQNPESLLCQKRCRACELRPRAVRVLGQRHQLCEIVRRLLPVASRLGRTSCSVESSVSIRIFLECRLELAQRRRCFSRLQQQIGVQLAHWIETVLRRHVLHAAVFAVGGGTHELHSLVARAFRERHPGGYRQDLFFRTSGPVRIFGLLQRCFYSLQRLDLLLRAGQIATARHAETAREADQGIGHRTLGRNRLKSRGALPVCALKGVTRGDNGERRVGHERAEILLL